MKPFPSHARRILLYMVVVGMLPVLLLTLENYAFSKKAVVDSEEGHLGYALSSRMTFLNAWLHHTKKEFFYASKSSCTIQDCSGHTEDEQQKNRTCKALQTVMRGHATYLSLAVYDPEWEILVTTTETKDIEIPPPSGELRKLFSRAKDFTTGPIAFAGGKAILPICQPTLDRKGNAVAFTVGYLDVEKSLHRILGKSSDIGETGKYFLLGANGVYLWAPEELRHLIGTRANIPEHLYKGPYKKVTQYPDVNNVQVLGISAPPEIPIDWILLAQIHESEAYLVVKERMLVSLLIAIVTLTLIGEVCFRLSNRLSHPLKTLAQVARNISSGKMKERAPEFAELETKEVSVAFNTMLDRLAASQQALARSESLAAVGELSSSIVHEMRSPLSSMRINLQALGEKVKSDPVYSEIADISIQQASRLEIMLVDLMNYGSPLKLDLVPITFHELVENSLKVVQEKANKKNITITVDDNLGDTTFKIDLELMTRALTNLLENGIHWAPENGKLSISGYPAPGEDDWVSIRVRDNGPGVQKGQRKKLFKLFYSTNENGHGIGLANVKKIIEYHGGFVAGDNMDDGGAVFSILLPVGGPES